MGNGFLRGFSGGWDAVTDAAADEDAQQSIIKTRAEVEAKRAANRSALSRYAEIGRKIKSGAIDPTMLLKGGTPSDIKAPPRETTQHVVLNQLQKDMQEPDLEGVYDKQGLTTEHYNSPMAQSYLQSERYRNEIDRKNRSTDDFKIDLNNIAKEAANQAATKTIQDGWIPHYEKLTQEEKDQPLNLVTNLLIKSGRIDDAAKVLTGQMADVGKITIEELLRRGTQTEKYGFEKGLIDQKYGVDSKLSKQQHQERMGEIDQRGKYSGNGTGISDNNLNESGVSDVDFWAQKLVEGEVTPNEIPRSRGQQGYKTLTAIFKKADELSSGKADFTASQREAGSLKTNMRALQAVETVIPSIIMLRDKIKTIPRGDLKGLNKVAMWFGEQTGNPDIVTFESLKSFVETEMMKSLGGGGQDSDARLEHAREALKGATSPEALNAVLTQALEMEKNRHTTLLDQSGVYGKNYRERLKDINPVVYEAMYGHGVRGKENNSPVKNIDSIKSKYKVDY